MEALISDSEDAETRLWVPPLSIAPAPVLPERASLRWEADQHSENPWVEQETERLPRHHL